MNTNTPNSHILAVQGTKELNGSGATAFRDSTKRALAATHTILEVDLAGTTFLDSTGLGALISLHKEMCSRGGQMRIVNPSPVTVQLFELTRLHRVFEIQNR